jgi:hypothetical protein
LKFGFSRKEVMPMAQSQTRIPVLPPLKIRGARGVMKRFAKGNGTVPGPGMRTIASLELNSSEAMSKDTARGCREILNLKHQILNKILNFDIWICLEFGF